MHKSCHEVQRWNGQKRSDSFCQLVMDAPQIQGLAPLSNSPDPRTWLMNHLLVQTVGNTNLVEIQVLGRSERVKSRDLQTLLETTVDVIRTDAMKTNTPVTVVNTTLR